jgi:hypothetical protein
LLTSPLRLLLPPQITICAALANISIYDIGAKKIDGGVACRRGQTRIDSAASALPTAQQALSLSTGFDAIR